VWIHPLGLDNPVVELSAQPEPRFGKQCVSSSPSRAKAFLTYDQGNWMLADIRL
jgi:hypothetical protein